LIRDAAAMERLMADLDGQDRIAVDTEADSFYSYREKVCLVQVTVEDRDYLVDPLETDISTLGRCLADPSKTKVFHDGEYDVLIMKRDYDFDFAGIFDTRVAAAALGMEAPGLASVLKDRFGVQLDKSMQRSNWADRPLSQKQIDYARLDTRFLLPLMDLLREELAEAGRTRVVDGECRRLELLQPPPPSFSPDEFVRVKGARTLDPIERQCLRELFATREGLAKSWNVPPFRVINNQVLINLCKIRPADSSKLGQVHGFSSGMVRRMGSDVLEAIERGLVAGPLNKFPRLPKKDSTEGFDEIQLELFDRMKAWRKRISEKHNIESSYLLNRHVMASIARENPTNAAQLDAINGLLEWQLEWFGLELLELLQSFRSDVQRGLISRQRPKKRWR
jgi:ribonuclease D